MCALFVTVPFFVFFDWASWFCFIVCIYIVEFIPYYYMYMSKLYLSVLVFIDAGSIIVCRFLSLVDIPVWMPYLFSCCYPFTCMCLCVYIFICVYILISVFVFPVYLICKLNFNYIIHVLFWCRYMW